MKIRFSRSVIAGVMSLAIISLALPFTPLTSNASAAYHVCDSLPRTTLKIGSRSQDVRKLQRCLVALDYKVKVDGIYGSATAKNVKSYQSWWNYRVKHKVIKGNYLKVDGIYGSATRSAMIKDAHRAFQP